MKKRRPPAGLTTDESLISYYTLYSPASPNEGRVFVLHRRLGTLSLLYLDKQSIPRVAAEEQFAVSELSLLRPLLEHYPHFCPYATLYASFYWSDTSEKVVARARERLEEAALVGTWDHEMRPIRNILSRMRGKLRDHWQIEVVSLLETGYMLVYHASPLPPSA